MRIPLLEAKRHLVHNGYTYWELPEGRYHLSVDGAAWASEGHLSERRHGRFETEVEVRAGQDLKLTARVPAGARLKLALRGAAEESDRRRSRAEWGDSYRKTLELRGYQARLRLLPKLGEPIPVEFRWECEEPPFVGLNLSASLELDTQGISELLPAGTHQLLGRLPGGRMAFTELTLWDGELTAAELSFE